MRYILKIFSFFATSLPAMAQDGVVIRCGTSSGQSYFFSHPVGMPEGGQWNEDGFATGEIILVNLGAEWDIVFDDAIGGHSYRKDGAAVFPILQAERFITVMAVRQPNYADLYTFDLEQREVAWSSQKIGGLMPKVAVYKAQCE